MIEMSEVINEITTSLVKCQSEFNAVGKDKKGYGYTYATLQNIVEKTRDILTSHGLAVTQWPISDGPSVGVITMISHESGQWIRSHFTMPTSSSKNLNAAQESGVVITYARRYAYAAALGIVVDEDNDGGNQPPRPKQNSKPAQKATDSNEALLPSQLKKFNTVGSKLYGDEWDDKRPELISHVTGGQSRSSKDATYDQLGTLINGMNTKLKAREAKSAEPTQPPLVEANGKGAY